MSTHIKTKITPDHTYSNGDEDVLGRHLCIINHGKGIYTFTLEEETFYPESLCHLNAKSPFKVISIYPKRVEQIEHGLTKITRGLEVSVNGTIDFKSKEMDDLITY